MSILPPACKKDASIAPSKLGSGIRIFPATLEPVRNTSLNLTLIELYSDGAPARRAKCSYFGCDQ
jgi:hypothetical protein